MTETSSNSVASQSPATVPAYTLLFALSGAAGLIYEVIWVRQFSHVLGASNHAITLILTGFMGGMALGAWFVGKWADRLDALRLARAYILLELGIGLYALILPSLLSGAEGLYVAAAYDTNAAHWGINTVRLLLASSVLAIPTALIGATLPVLSRYLIRQSEQVSVTVSRLYAANTLGAVGGTVVAGFLLLPYVGVRGSTLIACGINFAVALAFWQLNHKFPPSEIPAAKAEFAADKRSRMPLALPLAFFLSGVATMFYEIAWTRALSLVLGTTTYAFSVMLATFLTGIALGSALFGRVPRRWSHAGVYLGATITVAIGALATIPLFGKLPFLYLSAYQAGIDGWLETQGMRFLLAALVMLPATLALGMLIPAGAALAVKRLSHLGHRLGGLYGANTLGAAMGALVAGFFVLPLVGIQATIKLGLLLSMAGGLVMYLKFGAVALRQRYLRTAIAAVSATVLVMLVAPWSPHVLNSGVYVYAQRYGSMLNRYQQVARETKSVPQLPAWQVWHESMKRFNVLFHDVGPLATVAVMEEPNGHRFLTIDGKTDASTGDKSDLRTEMMIGHLPLLLHANPDKVLVVGLGSGITAGAVLRHKEVRIVDCAEFSPAVIKAARYFTESNNNALSDPRLKIFHRDARNMLLTSSEKYDVIVAQPSNPWISGQSDLFSLEWYRIAERHLQKNGLFLQWVPAYLMHERDIKIIANTLREVFPNLTVWSSGSAGDLIFLGSKDGPLNVDYRQIVRRLNDPDLRKNIAKTGLDPDLVPFNMFVMDDRDLGVYLYGDLANPLPKNSDDLLYTEYSTPKQLFQQKHAWRFLDPEQLPGNRDAIFRFLHHARDKPAKGKLKEPA